MLTKNSLLTCIASLVAWVGTAQGLEIGDPAPALDAAEWIKGSPAVLAEGKGKTVYVLEFWATWCGPCRMSIPHLTELQAKYKNKGVVILGISNEPPAKIKEFVDKMGDKMAYTVVADKEQSTSRTYMGGFEVNGIPHAFIVDKKGRIAWSGSPMGGMETAIDEILAGKFDLKASKQQVLAGRQMHEYFEKLVKAEALKDEKTRQEQVKEAAKLGQEVFSNGRKSAEVLNELSWSILTTSGIKSRDLPLALKAAKEAFAVSKGKDAAVADTYARALWDNGKKAEAVKLQKKAVELAQSGDAAMAKMIKATLDTYEKELASGPAGTPEKPVK